MQHVFEGLRMLGFVAAIGVAMALVSAAGCERNKDILQIKTPNQRVDVEQRPDGGLEINVKKK